jgi:nitrogen fixation/metabolism regulation signal transduction histidine kinase
MDMEKAAFMGKITAGVTHEMKNVLAIIKESAGLLEDLISLAKEGAPPPREKFLRTVNRIREQVARGVDLSTKLNLFAHSPDEKAGLIDLNQAAAQTGFLCQRFARLKNMTLHVEPHDQALIVETDPLGFQMLLYQCVELIMNLVAGGSIITLQPKDNDGNCVTISASPQSSEPRDTPARDVADHPLWETVQASGTRIAVWTESGGPPPWICVSFSRKAS